MTYTLGFPFRKKTKRSKTPFARQFGASNRGGRYPKTPAIAISESTPPTPSLCSGKRHKKRGGVLVGRWPLRRGRGRSQVCACTRIAPHEAQTRGSAASHPGRHHRPRGRSCRRECSPSARTGGAGSSPPGPARGFFLCAAALRRLGGGARKGFLHCSLKSRSGTTTSPSRRAAS